MVTITSTGQACGAIVTDIDLTEPISSADAQALRAGLAEHHVLAVPDQPMSDDDLERFSVCFGELGDDPWFEPIEGRTHIAEVRRNANETTPLFADAWHSDWSFLDSPPVATCLVGVEIPPVGGDTLFANQHLAYERLPDELRQRVDGVRATHTTKGIYGKGGIYDGDTEAESGRSMGIITDREDMYGEHPVVRVHPENGRKALFSTLGYVQSIVGMDKEESGDLLLELYQHQTADEVIYRHKWEPNMCVIWDNLSVLHKATGGYEGHDRVLHRTTIVQPQEA